MLLPSVNSLWMPAAGSATAGDCGSGLGSHFGVLSSGWSTTVIVGEVTLNAHLLANSAQYFLRGVIAYRAKVIQFKTGAQVGSGVRNASFHILFLHILSSCF